MDTTHILAHLAQWIAKDEDIERQNETRDAILNFWAKIGDEDFQYMLDNHYTWQEIHNLATTGEETMYIVMEVNCFGPDVIVRGIHSREASAQAQTEQINCLIRNSSESCIYVTGDVFDRKYRKHATA